MANRTTRIILIDWLSTLQVMLLEGRDSEALDTVSGLLAKLIEDEQPAGGPD